MLIDKMAGAGDLWGFSRLPLQHDLVGSRPELVGKELDQPHGRLIFARANYGRFVISAGGFARIETQAPLLDLLECSAGLPCSWRLEEDLPGLEVSNDVQTGLYSYRRLAEPKHATHRAGHAIDSLANTLLKLQASRARPVGLGKHGAETVLASAASVGQLKAFEPSQAQGQSRGVLKGSLILKKDRRAEQEFNELVPKGRGIHSRNPCSRRSLWTRRRSRIPHGAGSRPPCAHVAPGIWVRLRPEEKCQRQHRLGQE